MRKIIFVLLALLLTLAGCGKEALPETSSVPSEDTHITSPTEEKTEQSTVPSSEPGKTTEASEETAVSKAESGTSDSSVKEPKQNTSSGGPTKPTEKTAPAENTSPTEPTETTPTVPNASASDAGAIAELVAQYLNDYRTAQGLSLIHIWGKRWSWTGGTGSSISGGYAHCRWFCRPCAWRTRPRRLDYRQEVPLNLSYRVD